MPYVTLRRQIMKKKGIAKLVVVIAFTAMFLSGCKSDGSTDNGKASEIIDNKDEEYWNNSDSYKWVSTDKIEKWEVPENYDIDFGFRDSKDENNNYYFCNFSDYLNTDSTAYISGYSYEKHEEFFRLNLSDMANAVKEETGEFSQLYLDAYGIDKDGNIYFLTEKQDMMGKLSTYFVTYNVGQLCFEMVRVSEDFPERKGQTYKTVERVIASEDGYYYALVQGEIYVFDNTGNVCGSVTSANRIGEMFEFGGGVWYTVPYYQDDNYIFRIDEKGNVTDRKAGFTASSSVLGVVCGRILIRGTYGVTVYNPLSEENEMLFTWSDMDIVTSDVADVFIMSEDCIAVKCWDNEKQEYYITYIERKNSDECEVDDREEVVIGSMFIDSTTERNVADFNKSQDKYHVSLRVYNDYSESGYDDGLQFNLELAAGNAPDMIQISGFDQYTLADKKALEDMGAWLDNDEELSRGDYIESVLNACTVDDTLVAVPLEFIIYSVMGKKSELGSQAGWTIDDIYSYMQENSDALLGAYYVRQYIIRRVFMYDMDEFIDWEAGSCDFSQENFKKLLEIMMRHIDDTEDYLSYNDGNNMISDMVVFTFENMQERTIEYGDDWVVKGYPTKSGEACHQMDIISAYSILTTSKHKEGAWEFIKFSLKNYTPSMFPSDKARLQKLIDDELAHEGQEKNKQFFYDGQGYYYHYSTQEEIDYVLELIDNAYACKSYYDDIVKIINEETPAYFAKIRNADETAEIIQGRVQLYLDEQD